MPTRARRRAATCRWRCSSWWSTRRWCWGSDSAPGAIGLAVSDDGLLVLVLVAALPSASNVSMLAERFGADNGRIARIIMASTVLAFGSFSLIAWLFGVAAR